MVTGEGITIRYKMHPPKAQANIILAHYFVPNILKELSISSKSISQRNSHATVKVKIKTSHILVFFAF